MLSARLQLRQSQSLALTPQLLQSIRLLQHSHGEIEAFVAAAVERNPFLSRAGKGGGTGGARNGTQQGAIENVAADRPSLAAHALAEAADLCRTAAEMRIAVALAADLDDSGWLGTPVSITAERLGAPPAVAEALLHRLQAGAEPAGLFACSLADCLAIQLRRRNRFDPVMETVLCNLDLLARRDFAALRRLTGETEADLADILAEVRRLDPRPGRAFSTEPAVPVAPDVVVSAAASGGWHVALNADVLPRLIVNDAFETRVGGPDASESDRRFLGEAQASANWLVRALDQRARTILKVAREIVRRQDAFLLHGVGGLKPMTLMAVAESVGVHESTVSRVTANKFVATPRGTFEMKFFFTVAIAAVGGGDAHSAESVKRRIRLLIDAEASAAVLSDDDIAARLRGEGIDLARRTVAKYREALGIPSSVRRRRESNARRLAS